MAGLSCRVSDPVGQRACSRYLPSRTIRLLLQRRNNCLNTVETIDMQLSLHCGDNCLRGEETILSECHQNRHDRRRDREIDKLIAGGLNIQPRWGYFLLRTSTHLLGYR